MAGCGKSPKTDIFSLCMLMLITTTALPSAVDAVDTTTLPDNSSTTSTAEASGTASENQTSRTTTIPGTSSSSLQNTFSENETTSTRFTAVLTTPSSVQNLSVTPDSLTLFVGMLAGTQLDVTITAPNISLLNISADNATALFMLDNGRLLLNATLSRESTYVVTIATESNHTELLVSVDRLRFDQGIYLTTVRENTESGQCILNIDSNAERHGVAVLYSLTSAASPFSINSSTGELCVEGALDREEVSVYLLNVSLQLDQKSLLPHPGQGNTGVSGIVPDQGRTFASVLVKVDENDNGPSFDNIGRELILSVPENANDFYVIANLKANDPDEGLNGDIQYSLNKDSSGVFSINDGQLQVIAPNKLHDHHVFKLTVKAADVKRPCNDSYLDVKIFVVDNMYDFILPSKLPTAILTNNCQYVIEELGKILGLRLTQVRVGEHEQVDSGDSDRSELVFQALEIDANDTVHVNTSDIGIKVAGTSERIASLFGQLASVWNSTDVSASSQYTVNSLSKILIAVACLLFVATLVAVITACRLWKRFSCCRRRDNLSDQSSVSLDNWHFGDNKSMQSSHVSEFHEHKETSDVTITSQSDFTKTSQPDFTITSQSDFTKTSQLEKPLMFETPDTTFPFDAETHSLGLNTVARREHSRDQQMQRMQQLFQAVGSTMLQSKDSLYPKLDDEEHQEKSPSNLSDKQDTYLLALRSDVPEPANPSAAVIHSPDLGTPKLNTQGSGTSTSSPYPSILSKKEVKHEFATSKEHESAQQSSTHVLDSARSSAVLPQIPNSQLNNQHPPFENIRASHMLSTHTREDEQNVTPTHKSHRSSGLPLLTPVTSESVQHTLVDLHNANPGALNEQMEGKADSQRSFPTDSQDLDSLSQDVQDEDVQEEDVQEEDVQDEDIQDEDVQDEDVQEEDVQEEGIQDEDVQDEVVQDEDVQDEDVQEVLSSEDAVTHF